MESNSSSNSDRRSFIRLTALGVLGTGISKTNQNFEREEEPELLQIKSYRTLGRTKFKVSDISIGGTSLVFHDKEIFLRNLLKTGMNFIDASPIYGACETLIGNCLKDFDRKKLFLSTKYFPKKDFTKEDVLNSARQSLEKMKTDYVDCLQLQNCLSSDQVLNENWLSATRQLKEEGKIKHIGVACHGSAFVDTPRETMEEVLMTAINSGHYDLLMLAYNFLNSDQGNRIMKECHKKNIATTIMKTNPVVSHETYKKWAETYPENTFIKSVIKRFENAEKDSEEFMKLNNLKDYSALRAAAIKFILNNENVNTIPLTFLNYEDVDFYVPLSGQKLKTGDISLLNSYEEKLGKLYCRHGCNICEAACPAKVPVNTLLRFRHYYVGNGREAYALREYNSFKGPNAANCLTCDGKCQKLCPFEVPTQTLLIDAHSGLSLV